MDPEFGCPISLSEQNVKASKCSPPSLYHCLYNDLEEVKEICAHPIWVPAGNCPIYNIGVSKLNYVPCQTSRGECPVDVFHSNENFEYSGCIPPPRYRSTETTLTWEINTSFLNSTIGNTYGNTASSSPLLFLLALILVPIAIILLLLSLRWRRIHKRTEVNQKHEDEETAVTLIPHDKTQITSDHRDINEKYPSFPILQIMAEEFKSKRAVIIIGTWGSGKSTLANQIKEHVQQDPNLANAESIGLSNLNNWQMTVPEDRVSIVQLKDCVKNWYSEDYISAIRQDFKNLISQRPLCYFIILMRWPEWNRLNKEDSKIPYFHAQTIFEDIKESLIEWSLARNPFFLKGMTKQNLSDVIKLKNSLSEYGFTRDLGIGFPGLVNLICRNERLLSVARFAVKEPIQALYDDLKRLQDSEKPHDVCHFIILVYTMLCGGRFNLNFVNSDLLHKVRKLYPCGNEDPIEIFRKNPCEEYLDITSGQHIHLSLVHDVVARVLFKVVSINNMDLLIEECDADLLLDCIVVYGYKNLKEHQRLNFAKRLQLIELEKGTLDIKHHVFLQEKDFATAFHTVSEISADK